ncbi:hypothetical protein BYT27DRAFT_7188275 [Phlegmacium glaucopus]|nr:hypothetical protein BYT27DRAFT_7188275 [Phlegmacium glaucopus]
MTAMKTVEDPRRYHPQFNSLDADIVLVSADNTSYRVPSFTLRNACNLVHEPQTSSTHDQVIVVDEKDTVLSKVLCFICGLPTDQWDSIDQAEDALEFAQRWDALGPISVIRSSITAPLFLADPLRLYAIATRFGWDEEAQLASTHTLSLNLYDSEHRPKLERLTSNHLMALLRLHRFRRNEFKRLLDNDPVFDSGNTVGVRCTGSNCEEEVNNYAWRELKVMMFMEMDRRPRGDTLTGLEMEAWPEAISCWGAKCPGCKEMNYDKLATLRNIKECIDRLPVHI